MYLWYEDHAGLLGFQPSRRSELPNIPPTSSHLMRMLRATKTLKSFDLDEAFEAREFPDLNDIVVGFVVTAMSRAYECRLQGTPEKSLDLSSK